MSEERLDSLDERVRLLEQAVFELSTMAKYLKYAAVALFASLGVDVQGAMCLVTVLTQMSLFALGLTPPSAHALTHESPAQ